MGTERSCLLCSQVLFLSNVVFLLLLPLPASHLIDATSYCWNIRFQALFYSALFRI